MLELGLGEVLASVQAFTMSIGVGTGYGHVLREFGPDGLQVIIMVLVLFLQKGKVLDYALAGPDQFGTDGEVCIFYPVPFLSLFHFTSGPPDYLTETRTAAYLYRILVYIDLLAEQLITHEISENKRYEVQ